MLKTRQRTLFYRRTAWLNRQEDLENLLKRAHDNLPHTEDRTFDYNEGQIQGLCIDPRSAGLFCHVGYYIPKQPASLIPVPSKVKMEDTAPQNPPAKHDFLQGDIFFLVSENHLVLCPSSLHEHVAVAYIKEVFDKTGKDYLLKEFSVEPIANVNKLKLLNAEGVKKVLLNTSVYAATQDHIHRKSLKQTMVSGIRDVLDQFVTDDGQSAKDKENLSVNIEIIFDSRKKEGVVSKQKIEALAASTVDEKGFTIVTRRNKKLTFDEIRLSEKVDLPVEGSSVGREAAWNEIQGYFKRLKDTGMIEL